MIYQMLSGGHRAFEIVNYYGDNRRIGDRAVDGYNRQGGSIEQVA